MLYQKTKKSKSPGAKKKNSKYRLAEEKKIIVKWKSLPEAPPQSLMVRVLLISNKAMDKRRSKK